MKIPVMIGIFMIIIFFLTGINNDNEYSKELTYQLVFKKQRASFNCSRFEWDEDKNIVNIENTGYHLKLLSFFLMTHTNWNCMIPNIQKKQSWGGEFWSDGHFVSTVSKHGDENTIANYVRLQGIEDKYKRLYKSQQEQPSLFD